VRAPSPVHVEVKPVNVCSLPSSLPSGQRQYKIPQGRALRVERWGIGCSTLLHCSHELQMLNSDESGTVSL